MTALEAMKVSATQLGDLPGNTITGNMNKVAQIPLKNGIKVYMRPAPSEHFINATGKADSQCSTPIDDEEARTNGGNKKATAKSYASESTPNQVGFTDIRRVCDDRNRNSMSRKDNSPHLESSSSNGSLSTMTSGIYCELTEPDKPPSHIFSETKERRLLDNLIQFDEDEDERLYGVQTDEDLYQMWRNGDSRRASKTGSDVTNKRSSKPIVSTAKPAGLLTRREKKTNVICGWETLDNRKPPQRPRDERKQRAQPPNYYSKYVDKETNGTDSNFAFFHYTDIARYIQQYRQDNVCENSYTSFPNCCHDSHGVSCATGHDGREINYPIKFDLASTNSYRHRIGIYKAEQERTRAGMNTKATGTNDGPPSKAIQTTTKMSRSPVPGYLSPVAFRPPYKPRTPTNDVKSEHTRLNCYLKKMWRSYGHKPPETQQHSTLVETLNAIERKPPSNIQLHTDELPLRLRSESLLHRSVDHVPSIESEETKEEVQEDKCLNEKSVSDAESAEASIAEETPYQALGKCFTIPRLHQLKLEHKVQSKTYDNAASHNLFNETVLQEDYFNDDQDGLESDGKFHYNHLKGSFTKVDSNTRLSNAKNIRMKTLIAAEIYNLQQRKIISYEQKRKLEKFRQALSHMPHHPSKPSSALPPSGSATQRIIAGSVRAYYTRTAQQDRHVTECQHMQREYEVTDEQEDKPIIVVSQPHLRHLSAGKKPISPLLSKKLIGGKANDKGNQHPADTKQFTRITDLLRIKKRQQSSRRVASDSSRLISANSAEQRNDSSGRQRNKSRHKNTGETSTKSITKT